MKRQLHIGHPTSDSFWDTQGNDKILQVLSHLYPNMCNTGDKNLQYVQPPSVPSS